MAPVATQDQSGSENHDDRIEVQPTVAIPPGREDPHESQIDEKELARRGEIASSCLQYDVIEIQSQMIEADVAIEDAQRIAQIYAITKLSDEDDLLEAFRALIVLGVTEGSFYYGITKLRAEADEKTAINTAIIGNEGMRLPEEKS